MRAEVITINREPAAIAAVPAPTASLTGVILASADAARFGGTDTGLIPIGGRSLVKRVLEQLVMQVRHIIIVTNRNQSLYASLGYRVISDAADTRGGLSGIAVGLAAIQTSHALFVPVDAARLPGDLAQSLWQVQAARNVPCLVHTAGAPLPSCCLLPRSERQSAEAALADGTRDALEWLRSRCAIEVDFNDCPPEFWRLPGPEGIKALEKSLLR